jgi:hypothetical protein
VVVGDAVLTGVVVAAGAVDFAVPQASQKKKGCFTLLIFPD